VQQRYPQFRPRRQIGGYSSISMRGLSMNFRFSPIAAVVMVALFSSTAAFATSATCSKAPADKFKPQADLIALLKTKGITVSRVKVEKGCYEVYGKDAADKKVNAAFNAETLDPVDSPEAGEN
jgi:hypothetical protein